MRSQLRMALITLAFAINVYNISCLSLSSPESLHAEEEIAALENRLLNVMGFDRKPNPNKNKAKDNSATLFMRELYEKVRIDYGNPEMEARRESLRSDDTFLPESYDVNCDDVIVSFVNQANQTDFIQDGIGYQFYFNFNDIEPDWNLSIAELKLYKEQSVEGILTTYQIQLFVKKHGSNTGDLSPQPEVLVTVTSQKAGWIGLNVTNIAKYWSRNPSRNLGMYMKIIDMNNGQETDGIQSGILTDNSPDDKQPFMIGIYSATPAVAEDNELPPILVRAGENDDVTLSRNQQATQSCQRQEMYVDFASVGWNSWIIAPAGYQAYYCSGGCTFPLADHMNGTVHAIVQSLIHSRNPDTPQPCCVPTKLSPVQLLYIDDNSNAVLKMYKEMKVDECGCH